MENSFDSIIQNYNQKNDYLSKIWTWIAIISIFGLVIMTRENDSSSDIEVPFVCLKVPANYFLAVFITILTGLTIRWIEAFHRSILLRQKVIEKVLRNNKKITIESVQIKSRSLIDGIVNSSTTSVWGIIPDYGKKNSQIPIACFRLLAYVILKIVVFIAHFVLPALAILLATIKLKDTSMHITIKIIVYFIAIVGLITILRAMVSEFKYGQIAFQNQLKRDVR